MGFNTIIVEIVSPYSNDLTYYLGEQRSTTISSILNSSADIAYVTNCEKFHNLIKFNLMPSAYSRLFLAKLNNSKEGHKLFLDPNINEIMDKAYCTRINAFGHFELDLRSKLIGNTMFKKNYNLGLLQNHLLGSPKDMEVLVYPNGVHNSVVSTVQNELASKIDSPTITVSTPVDKAKYKYIPMFESLGINPRAVESSLTVINKPIQDIDLTHYSRVYLEQGKGYNNDEITAVIDLSEVVQQLYIYNHERMHGYSTSEVQLKGLITDQMLDRVEPEMVVSESSSSSPYISSDPLA